MPSLWLATCYSLSLSASPPLACNATGRTPHAPRAARAPLGPSIQYLQQCALGPGNGERGGREPFAPWGAALRGELLSVGSCSPWELLSVGSCSPWGAALRGELLSVGSCSPWGAALRGELLSVGSCSPWGAALRAELLSVGRCSALRGEVLPWGGALRGEKGLGVTWDVPLYGELLKIGGGKERMTPYFNQVGWPQAAPIDPSERAAFVAGPTRARTALFMQACGNGALPLRPGVARALHAARGDGCPDLRPGVAR
ncbi:unnamed protein product [Closterium sp. NIES-64]|nr:unnamed protein product [Closterium sp. NIES-64]